MGGGLTTPEQIEHWERLIEEGHRDTVTREFLREITGMDDETIDLLATTPLWEARRQIVPTLPRELRAERAHRFDEWAVRSVDAHTDALPGAEKRVLEGQGHGANMTAPELLAEALVRFFATGSDSSREP